VPTGLHHQINEMKPDIVQFHWVGNDTLSIWEIKKINAPIVWKLPDMWAFSGCAHYTLPGFENWYSDKKKIKAGLPYDGFVNFEALMINLKKIAFYRANISFVGPSSWITKLVQFSYLHREKRAKHIINPIDTGIWKRQLSSVQREKFNLNQNDFVVITSSMNALSDPRKGHAYMEQILEKLKSKNTSRCIKLAVIGEEGQQFEINGVKCIPLGKSYDEAELALLYSVGDAYIFPSTMDNLANTLKEATCCGLPCVAFNIGGNSDMVIHGKNGYLIEPFDTDDFANKIVQLEAMSKDELSALSMITEQIAHKLHSQSTASNNYFKYYREILGEM
jgi:glycosyltransferase involved in cell wall biosynthesis